MGRHSDNSVWISSANDGSNVATYRIIGTPWAMVSTPNSTWIGSAEGGNGYLTEVNSTSGIIRTFVLPTVPYALIWVQYSDNPADPFLLFVDAIGDNLWSFDPATGYAGIFSVTGLSPSDLWDLLFDGINVWIIDSGNGRVTQMSGSVIMRTFSTPYPPTALVSDGSTLWVASKNNFVTRLSVSDGQLLPPVITGAVPGAGPGANPSGMAFDGANIWITDMDSNTMVQIRASDGAVLGTHPTGPNPVNVVFDGTRLWVANSGSNTVTRYQPGAPG